MILPVAGGLMEIKVYSHLSEKTNARKVRINPHVAHHGRHGWHIRQSSPIPHIVKYSLIVVDELRVEQNLAMAGDCEAILPLPFLPYPGAKPSNHRCIFQPSKTT